MTDLSAPQRALHDYLLAYHRPGLSQEGASALTLAGSCDLKRLVELGLVELRYVPIPRAEEPEGAPAVQGPARPRAAAPPAPPSPPAPPREAERRPRWTEERKMAYIAALVEHGSVARANEAVGLPKGSVAAYSPKRGDPAFSAEWDAAVAKHKAPKEEPPRPFVPAPAAGADNQAASDELGGASRADLPRRARNGGDGPLSERPRERPASRRNAAVGEGSEERTDGLGHRGLAPRVAAAPRSRDRVIADHDRHQREQETIDRLKPPMSEDMAADELRRRGFSVNRMSTFGGSSLLWRIDSRRDLSGTDLIAKARAVIERVNA